MQRQSSADTCNLIWQSIIELYTFQIPTCASLVACPSKENTSHTYLQREAHGASGAMPTVVLLPIASRELFALPFFLVYLPWSMWEWKPCYQLTVAANVVRKWSQTYRGTSRLLYEGLVEEKYQCIRAHHCLLLIVLALGLNMYPPIKNVIKKQWIQMANICCITPSSNWIPIRLNLHKSTNWSTHSLMFRNRCYSVTIQSSASFREHLLFVFIHIDLIWTCRFRMRIGINFTRAQASWIVAIRKLTRCMLRLVTAWYMGRNSMWAVLDFKLTHSVLWQNHMEQIKHFSKQCWWNCTYRSFS